MSTSLVAGNSTGKISSAISSGMSLKESEANEKAIKKFATNFLGCGCNQQGQPGENGLELLDCISEKFSKEQVRIFNPKSLQQMEADVHSDAAIQRLNQQFQATFGFTPTKKISAGASLQTTSSSEAKREMNQITCVVRQLDLVECSFNKTPSLSTEKMRGDRRGDAFVSGGYIYSGYELFFTMSSDSTTNEEANRLPGRAGLSLLDLFRAGLSAEQIREKSKEVRVSSIRADITAFGGYRCTVGLHNLVGVEGIFNKISEVQADYFRQLPQITTREFYIAPKHLTPLAAPTTPMLPSPSSKAEDRNKFSTLANSMIDSFSEEYKATLAADFKIPTLSLKPYLMAMLQAIDTVFSTTLEETNVTGFYYAYTLLLGKSGNGKSLFAGYLLEHPLELKQSEESSDTYDYKYESRNRRPSIGHLGSETVGAHVYQKYIDTAGIEDTDGIGKDICNAIAISMATKKYSPKRLIVVIHPGVFGGRAQDFINLIHLLKRCVRNLTDEKVWSSLLFVVNNRDWHKFSEKKMRGYQEDILKNVKRAISIQEAERNKIIPEATTIFEKIKKQVDVSPLGMFKIPFSKFINRADPESDCSTLGEAAEELQNIDPASLEKFKNLQENIELLQLFLDHKNFLIANFSDEKTRQKIQEWERDEKTGNLSCDDFTTENLVDGGFAIFNRALVSIALYFSILANQRKSNEEQIAQLTMNIDAINDTNQMSAKSTSDDTKSNEKTDEVLEKIRKKEKELEELNSDTVIPWLHLKPKEPIVPRSIFAIYAIFSKEYLFEYTGGVPIDHVMPNIPNSDEKIPIYDSYLYEKMNKPEFSIQVLMARERVEKAFESGEIAHFERHFIQDSDTELSKGIYKASYIPKWYGYKEDADVEIILHVKRKDDPSSITARELIKSEIKGLKEQVGNSLSTQREPLLQKNRDIAAKIDPFKDFCDLIVKIIDNLDLLKAPNESDREIYRQFYQHFNKPKFLDS